mmetsp:Transcript_11395/g.16565  ORF Transcript_11395/g.16565 Transcript_11395/m.16565 type:complete len:174 (+) Transcript_11395:2469-2990(+)
MLVNWENTLSQLLPACLVAAENSKKLRNANIPGVGGGGALKKVGPETGVEVWYYKYDEYKRLFQDQRKDLSHLRSGKLKTKCDTLNKGGQSRKSKSYLDSKKEKKSWNKQIKSSVAALIKKQNEDIKAEHNKETAELEELDMHLSANAAPSGSKEVSEIMKLNTILKSRLKKE